MFNWMLGQLRRVVERSYVRGKAPNLNRLSSERKNIKPHSRPNSVFAQFSVVCIFNWILDQLRKAIKRSYIRERAPNLNRLSREKKYHNPHPQPNSVFAQFSIVCMFNWMLGRLRKAVERSCLEGVCSWKSSRSQPN